MFETTIKLALAADAPLAALVGTRIRTLNAAQGEARPYVAYLVTDDDDPSPTFTGPSIFTRPTYDVVVVADTYKACAQLSVIVRRILGNYIGTNDGTKVVWTKYDGQTDIEQGTDPGKEKPLYVRSLTFRAMYRAA